MEDNLLYGPWAGEYMLSRKQLEERINKTDEEIMALKRRIASLRERIDGLETRMHRMEANAKPEDTTIEDVAETAIETVAETVISATPLGPVAKLLGIFGGKK